MGEPGQEMVRYNGHKSRPGGGWNEGEGAWEKHGYAAYDSNKSYAPVCLPVPMLPKLSIKATAQLVEAS